jgi:hypothetical protein
MKNKIIAILLISFFAKGYSQVPVREFNKLTFSKTYAQVEINKSLRDFIDQAGKEEYFNDDFFNNQLKAIVQNQNYSEKDKALLFYLMQKKIGFAFYGSAYIPPKQNYFSHHLGKVYIYQKTKLSLKDLNYDVANLLALVDSNRNKDAILASSALLLATLLNTDNVGKKLEYYSQEAIISQSKNPEIFNHFVCLTSSMIQDSIIVRNLNHNLMAFTSNSQIEDVLCAIYSKKNPVTTIKTYILNEKNPKNELAIQTALCALADKVPPAAFQQSVKVLIASSHEKWKTDLFKNISANKIPYNYALSSNDLLVTKV